MFNYKLLIVLVIITISSSIPVRKSLLNEPKRCCAPKQYSSKIIVSFMTLLDDTTYKSYAHYNFSYDENLGMIGIKGVSFNVPDQQQTKSWIIENINNGQSYTIDLDTKQCYKSNHPINPMNCIPENAIYIDSTIYGYGDKKILGDTWLVKLNETIIYSTVSRGDCVPLAKHFFYEEPPMVVGLTTTSFVEDIDDPSIFDIPPECKNLF